MKLLIDANISYRLVKLLSESNIDSLYVSKTGLPQPAKDSQIWDFAKQNNYTILTFDADFKLLEDLRGFPPKVILFNTGNSSTKYILKTLLNKLKDIDLFVREDFRGVMEIY